jgi:aldose sugar dehydrogenase
LIIDSVKITSWDTNKNDYARANGTIPRSYILVNYGNGTTNITNSELAYLGYQHARSFGLTYYTGAGSIIKNNKIHDLWYGFYSDGFAHGAYNITIAGNEFYKNTLQGIGPHSSSHHLTISNNTVHNNGRDGIICSTDCYNIIIDSNRVFNNSAIGILFRDNVTNSVISNNIVYDNKQGQISLDKLANNNSVFVNKINRGLNGIRVSEGSANNTINNNTIANSYSAGIYLLKGASQNTVTSNKVNNSNNALLIVDRNSINNVIKHNNFLNSNNTAIRLRPDNTTNKFENNTSYVEPIMRDPNLNAKLVFNGLESPKDVSDLSPVSKFEFLGINDIIILEKNNGKVYRIVNGTLLKEPLLDTNVANEWDRGLLGIALIKNENKSIPTSVFLFFTESKTSKDGADDCPTQFYCKEPNSMTISNSIYRYDLINNKLINPKLILSLPAVPGPRHNGGDLVIGPDHNLYATVGDLEGARTSATRTKSMNYQNGTEPDGRSGILRILLNGTSIGKGIVGDFYPLNLYYGYGIRNSFGIDFDPVTGILWDTENGDHFGDEINFVLPGFNSGWKDIEGVWKISDSDLFNYNPAPKYKGFNASRDQLPELNLNLVQFGGRGQYSAPEFVWNETVAPSAIKFLNSQKYGTKYLGDLIVGDFKFGNLYRFDLNINRTELLLKGELSDKIANNQKELEETLLGLRFGKITDLEVGPDGYLYVLALNSDRASLFKIIPSG